MADYDREKALPGFDLKTFVDRHFSLPPQVFPAYLPRPDEDVRAYVREFWQALERKPDEIEPWTSPLPLITLTSFRAAASARSTTGISYFVMLGLCGTAASTRPRHARQFRLADRPYGHIPNGRGAIT